jgi:hypothetical protein
VDSEANLVALPDDSQALKAMLRTLIERDERSDVPITRAACRRAERRQRSSR